MEAVFHGRAFVMRVIACVLDEILHDDGLPGGDHQPAETLPDLQAETTHERPRGLRQSAHHELVAFEHAEAGGLGTEHTRRLVHDQRQDVVGLVNGGEAPCHIVQDLETTAPVVVAPPSSACLSLSILHQIPRPSAGRREGVRPTVGTLSTGFRPR